MTRGDVSPSSIDMVRLLIVSLLAGCSGFTTHRAAPVIDTVVAASGAAMIVASQQSDDRELMVAGTAVLIAFGIAAIHGFEHLDAPTPAEP